MIGSARPKSCLEIGHKVVEVAERSSHKTVEITKMETKALEQVHLTEMGGAPKVVILLLGAAAHHAFMVQLDQMDRGSKLLPDRPTRPHILSITEIETDQP